MLSCEEQNHLRQTKVGDEVAVRRLVYGKWQWIVATIDRLTPQHLVIGTDLFSKRTGELRGFSRTLTRIAPLNAKYRQRIETAAAQEREDRLREECITTLLEDILRTLPTRLLQELARQVQECLQSEGRAVPETVEGWNALRAEQL